MKQLVFIVFCSLFSLYVQAQEESAPHEEKPKTYTFADLVGNDRPVLLTRESKSKYPKVTYYSDEDIKANIENWRLNWSINCQKKSFDNKKVCYMTSGNLWVFLINGKYSVDVGSNHYPRTKAGLRIDNGSAIYGYEGEIPDPLSVIEKLKKGKVAYTRYQEWPYQSDTEGEVNLIRFTKHFNEMLNRYKNL